MTPELLIFEAFGPYVKKQEIDFRVFERAGLFLIHGKTGAGKTTVLDAMTYALFGESSGGGRGEITAMRCDLAPDEQDTLVDFIFSIKQMQYRFTRGVRMRTKRNGEKELQPSQSAFFKNKEGVFEPFFENPGVRNVRQKAEELLGLTYEQFRQVVLLPQGKFEQLLVADSAAKEEILVTLFKAEKWQEITDWLCAKALELKRTKEETAQKIFAVLSQYGCDESEELKTLAGKREENLQESEKLFAQAEKEADMARSVLQNAQTVAALFDEWEQAKKKVTENEARAETVSLLEEKCARASSAMQLYPLRKEAATLQKLWKEREERAKNLQNSIEEITQKHEKCVCLLAGVAGDVKEKHVKLGKNIADLKERQKGVREEYQALFSAYLGNAAHLLAGSLEEGKACPVCGNEHHPAPASGVGEQTSSAEVERAEQEGKRIAEQIAEAERESFILTREAEECAEALRLHDWDGTRKAEHADSKQMKKLIAEAERLRAEHKTKEAAHRDVITEAEQAKRAFEQAMEEFRTACEKKGFATDEAFRSAYMSEQETEEAQREIREYYVQKELAEQSVKSCAEKLDGKEPMDILPLQSAFAQREEEKKKIEAALAENRAMIAMLKKACSVIEQHEKKLREQTEEYIELDSFSKLLRGSNGVSIQRYVLGVMLSAITQQANMLLKKVHDGRYQLFRAIEGTGRSRKVGLDLEVFDAYSGERRSVNSLSGGEKFLAALALSLGLSSVVQAQSGGIRIDAMFIDEGFGSLDAGSIEDALDILAGVRETSGLIGIISHVQMLKENIEATIEVKKERDGSDLIINC